MSSYAIIGASRGIGLEFVRQLSKDSKNTVFAVVRSPENVDPQLLTLTNASANVRIVKGDLSDLDSLLESHLLAAAVEVGKVTGGKLDYLINNAAAIFSDGAQHTIATYPDQKDLEKDLIGAFQINAIGVAHTINAFLPLLREGTEKKIIAISTANGVTDFVLRAKHGTNVPYAVSKAALNMIVAEFAVALKPEGFIVLAISPGVVSSWTDELLDNPADQPDWLKAFVPVFRNYDPSWSGVPLTPAQSVGKVLAVVSKAKLEDSGTVLSHHGNQEWL